MTAGELRKRRKEKSRGEKRRGEKSRLSLPDGGKGLPVVTLDLPKPETFQLLLCCVVMTHLPNFLFHVATSLASPTSLLHRSPSLDSTSTPPVRPLPSTLYLHANTRMGCEEGWQYPSRARQ